MDHIVVKETTLLTPEDKALIRKNTIFSIIAVLVIETIAYLMMFHFIDTKDMEIMRWVFFGFFMLVGLVLVFMNVSSYLDKNKIVSTGYITNKRISASRSTSSKGSSRTDYYFTLGNEEMSVIINHYSQVETGDKIRLHQTKWNKSIFKIEVLESAAKQVAALSPKELHNLEMSIHEDYMDAEEKSLIRSKFFKLVFWRAIVLGGVAYVMYYIILIVGLMALPTQVLTDYRYAFVIVPAIVPVLFYILLNKKTYTVFLDFSQGKKRVMTKIITNIVQNNRPMTSKNTIITSGSTGEYYYVITHDKAFFQIAAELGRKTITGDRITVHEAFNSKVVLNASEPTLKTTKI